MRTQLFLILAVAYTTASIKHYDGYKVFTVTPENDAQAGMLAFFEGREGFHFWSEVRKGGHPTTVMVSPEVEREFRGGLEKHGVPFTVIVEDAERVFEHERHNQMRAAKTLREEKGVSFDKFLRYDEIQAYLEQLAADHSEIVTVGSIGKSYEGREISIIRISTGGGGTKPVILIDAGIHAREWIAPAQALYIIRELVENEGNGNFIEAVDWHIIPVLNPDGYEYSHTNERLWRKTRSKNQHSYGTDGNRNFGLHWMEIGASNSEISDIYAGPYPFSEPETRALKSHVGNYSSTIKLYLTFHSYGQYIIFPWGYTEELPVDANELMDLGMAAKDAIWGVNGTKYTVGETTKVLYGAAGGSDDWTKGIGGVDLAYTIELPGGGTTGFDPDATEILPIVEEMFEGILVFHDHIKKKFP